MKANEGKLRVMENIEALAEAGADVLLETALEGGIEGTRVALSGGSTPKHVYQALQQRGESAASVLRRVDFFFGDERTVPNDHPDSNIGLAEQHLFQPLGVPEERIHRYNGGAEDLEAEAELATRDLHSSLPQNAQGVPVFDLIFLGMGPDGHTASLFPGTAALQKDAPGFVVNEVPQLETTRLTLTYPVLNAAKRVVILCAGADKSPVLKEIFDGSEARLRFPIERVDAERLEWLVDPEAAAELAAPFKSQ